MSTELRGKVLRVGSRVYGTHSPKSDHDLVALSEYGDMYREYLTKRDYFLQEKKEGSREQYKETTEYWHKDGVIINLILVGTATQMALWARMTELVAPIAQRPEVTREEYLKIADILMEVQAVRNIRVDELIDIGEAVMNAENLARREETK